MYQIELHPTQTDPMVLKYLASRLDCLVRRLSSHRLREGEEEALSTTPPPTLL